MDDINAKLKRRTHDHLAAMKGFANYAGTIDIMHVRDELLMKLIHSANMLIAELRRGKQDKAADQVEEVIATWSVMGYGEDYFAEKMPTGNVQDFKEIVHGCQSLFYTYQMLLNELESRGIELPKFKGPADLHYFKFNDANCSGYYRRLADRLEKELEQKTDTIERLTRKQADAIFKIMAHIIDDKLKDYQGWFLTKGDVVELQPRSIANSDSVFGSHSASDLSDIPF